MHRLVALAALVVACAEPAPLPDTSDWWGEGEPYDVQERLRFTDEPYADLPGTGRGIADFIDRTYPATTLTVAPDDRYPSGSACSTAVNRDLPAEIEGIVTLHPRWYAKLQGCNRAEEKYYGNWFIEDATAGLFVVGDSKVAHFDVGDRVKLRVRGVLTNFGQDMIYVHDVLEIHREARPIYYQQVDRALDERDMGQTRRVRGVVTSRPDTFGDFTVQTESGARVNVSLDAELNRRRVHPPLDSTLCVTGPVQFSFSQYSIPIMRIGQIVPVADDQACPD